MRMNRFGVMLALGLSLATAGFATPGQDMVTASLQAQGYEVTLVHWTWLGRIRIIAVNADLRREIVINPTTGEILRDYSHRIEAAVAGSQDDHDMSSDSATARLSDEPPELDASAISALETMQVGVAPTLLPGSGQN